MGVRGPLILFSEKIGTLQIQIELREVPRAHHDVVLQIFILLVRLRDISLRLLVLS